MPILLRPYGVSGHLDFPLLTVSSAVFASGLTMAASDVGISKDGAAMGTATAAPTHVGRGMWTWAYTASQATAKRMSIVVRDQSGTKAFEDQGLLVETYGNAAAHHKFNLNATGVTVASNSDKTSYTLTTAQHDAIGDRAWASTTRTLTSGSTVAGSVWVSTTRTLTSGATVASSVWVSSVRTLSATGYDLVWDEPTAGHTATTAFGGNILVMPAQVWSYATRTLTAGGGSLTASGVWTYATRTLTSGDAVASSVWVSSARTLTSGANVWSAATKVLTSGAVVWTAAGRTLSTSAYTAAADAMLNRDMSAVTGTTARSPLNALRFLRNKWSATGGTLTVYKEDDLTSAWTSALTTATGANPVTSSDPA